MRRTEALRRRRRERVVRRMAEALRRWRRARGLSQRALAEQAGVGYVLVARLELGQTDPRLSTLHRLARALKVRVAALVGDRLPLTGRRKPARRRAGRR
jgi:transcriptional regulator with XRE-family HTH domain